MNASAPATPEILRAPPRPWLRRLWVRVSLVLLLIGAIGAATWWWPRRTMVAVWWVGGQTYCDADRHRANVILTGFDPARASGLWSHFSRLYRILGWASEDRDVTFVNLKDSRVGDAWLETLHRCTQLSGVGLHDRQLGPGLDHLSVCAKLNSVSITSASNRRLAELRRLPQLEDVSLWEPQSGDLGLDSLTALPMLKSLFVGNCRSTNEVLAAMPELPQLETLVIQSCGGFVDDDLQHLQRLRNLKSIDIVGQTPLGDAALEHLSQLIHLEKLALRSPSQSVTQNGMRALSRMKSLKELIVLGFQWTPKQLKMLRDELPNCTITVL